MTRTIISAACGLWLCAAQGALAQDSAAPQTAAPSGLQPSPVVVELYTSQGCSSCPPADALLAGLADQPGIMPLALHVDYWDYIGWADEFAHPGFTKRQKAYAHAAGERMIYTPQMIVGGVDRVVGNEPEAVAEAIARAVDRQSPVRLRVTRSGGRITIEAWAEPPLDAPVMVQLVGYRPGARVDIGHGENAGLSVDYRNIVTSWQPLGEWAGQRPLEMTTEAGEGPQVVIVQQQGPAAILASAVLP